MNGLKSRVQLLFLSSYLAEMLGHPRETISRALKTLEGQGLVKYLDKKFIVNQQKLIECYRNL